MPTSSGPVEASFKYVPTMSSDSSLRPARLFAERVTEPTVWIFFVLPVVESDSEPAESPSRDDSDENFLES